MISPNHLSLSCCCYSVALHISFLYLGAPDDLMMKMRLSILYFFVSPSQELQKGMDAHKSEVLSINLSSADFLQSEPDSEEAWALKEGLKEMNTRWDRLGTSLEEWREELQRALMQCQVLQINS